ncbi:MAG: amidase family protein, partial [Ancalomicrobiaceae bacterium]|nr:amidase family protein [Ancalomicrobiaceae bacterium]
PGGSSSGSAVAVASGLVPVAVGSDTGGSVRIPAAFNGIVGYKSSAGRYDMGGVFPLSRTLDTLGVFAHSAADAAIVDAAMRRLVAPSARRADIRLLTLIVPDNVVFERVQPAVAANFSAALDRLTEAGARIERRTIAAFDAILALFERCGPLAGAEAYHLHRGRVEDPAAAAAMDRRVVDRVLLGRRTSAPDYQDLLIARQQLRAEAAELFDVGRCVAFPTVAHVAPAIAPLEADRDLFVAVNALTLRNTMLGNFLDWCGVSLPSGTDTAGLPTGFLINGGPGQDDDLLGTALAIEDLVRGPGRPDTF